MKRKVSKTKKLKIGSLWRRAKAEALSSKNDSNSIKPLAPVGPAAVAKEDDKESKKSQSTNSASSTGDHESSAALHNGAPIAQKLPKKDKKQRRPSAIVTKPELRSQTEVASAANGVSKGLLAEAQTTKTRPILSPFHVSKSERTPIQSPKLSKKQFKSSSDVTGSKHQPLTPKAGRKAGLSVDTGVQSNGIPTSSLPSSRPPNSLNSSASPAHGITTPRRSKTNSLRKSANSSKGNTPSSNNTFTPSETCPTSPRTPRSTINSKVNLTANKNGSITSPKASQTISSLKAIKSPEAIKSSKAKPKKVLSPINNRYHDEKALQEQQASIAALEAAEMASTKLIAASAAAGIQPPRLNASTSALSAAPSSKKTDTKKKKKSALQKFREEEAAKALEEEANKANAEVTDKSPLQQFREEQAAKARHNKKLKVDIELAENKRRAKDLRDGRGCLMDGICRTELTGAQLKTLIVAEDPEGKILTPKMSNTTPKYGQGEFGDEGFEMSTRKKKGKTDPLYGGANVNGNPQAGNIELVVASKPPPSKSAVGKKKSNSGFTASANNKSPPKKKASQSSNDPKSAEKFPPKKKGIKKVKEPPSESPQETSLGAGPKNAAAQKKSNLTSSQTKFINEGPNVNTDLNGASNEPRYQPKMSPKSKARMQRHKLASNSLTETDGDGTFRDTAYSAPKYGCFGSEAIIIPDATSEESDIFSDVTDRGASASVVGRALDLDLTNIDRVADDSSTLKGFLGLFRRGTGRRNSHLSKTESIFDGFEDDPDLPLSSINRGGVLCDTNPLSDMFCGGEELVMNEKGELRIRTIASIFSVEADANDAASLRTDMMSTVDEETIATMDDDTTYEEELDDEAWDESNAEDETDEELDDEIIGAAGSSIMERISESYEEDDISEEDEESEEGFQTGTDTEGSIDDTDLEDTDLEDTDLEDTDQDDADDTDLDEIIEEESGSDAFDSVSATTSSSQSSDESDGELPDMVSRDYSLQTRWSKQSTIPEKLVPTPISVMSPISLHRNSTLDTKSTAGRRTSSFKSISSFFKRNLSYQRSVKSIQEKDVNDDLQSDSVEREKEEQVPTQVLCEVSTKSEALSRVAGTNLDDTRTTNLSTTSHSGIFTNPSSNLVEPPSVSNLTVPPSAESNLTELFSALDANPNSSKSRTSAVGEQTKNLDGDSKSAEDAVDTSFAKVKQGGEQECEDLSISTAALPATDVNSLSSKSRTSKQGEQEAKDAENKQPTDAAVSVHSSSASDNQGEQRSKDEAAPGKTLMSTVEWTASSISMMSNKEESLDCCPNETITEQISLDVDGIEVSFSSKSDKELSRTASNRDIANRISQSKSMESTGGKSSKSKTSESPAFTSSKDNPSSGKCPVEPVEEKEEKSAYSKDQVGGSSDSHSGGQQEESRQDVSCTEADNESLRQGMDTSLDKHLEDLKKHSFEMDSLSLDSTRISEGLSTTTEGIEILNPEKVILPMKRLSKVGKIGSFFADRALSNVKKQPSLVSSE